MCRELAWFPQGVWPRGVSREQKCWFKALVPIWEVRRALPELFVPLLAFLFWALLSNRALSLPVGGGPVVQCICVLNVLGFALLVLFSLKSDFSV